MKTTKKRRFYKPEIMLNLVTQIKERGDIIDIIERNSFSDSGFRKALTDYKGFYKIKNKEIRKHKTQKIKKLNEKLQFLNLAYSAWRKGLNLKNFASENNLNNDSTIHKLTRLGIFWKKNIDYEVTNNTFKNIILEYENEIKDLERELSV